MMPIDLHKQRTFKASQVIEIDWLDDLQSVVDIIVGRTMGELITVLRREVRRATCREIPDNDKITVWVDSDSPDAFIRDLYILRAKWTGRI